MSNRPVPLTKAEKLRKASKVAWFISMLFTANYIKFVIGANNPDWSPIILWGMGIVCASGFQYAITLMESALFDGSLPPPWRIQWAEGGPLPWIMAGAFVCLLVDILLNIGGVAYFTSRLHESNIGQDTLGFDDSFAKVISKLITVVVAVFFAVASELLDTFADYTEGRKRTTWVPQQQKGEPDPGGKHASQQHSEAKARAARDQEAAATRALIEREAASSHPVKTKRLGDDGTPMSRMQERLAKRKQ